MIFFDFYYDTVSYHNNNGVWTSQFLPELITPHKLTHNLVNADTGQVMLRVGDKITPRLAKKLASEGLVRIKIANESLIGKVLAQDIINKETGEVIINIGEIITAETLTLIEENDISILKVIAASANTNLYIRNTLFADKNTTQALALSEVFKVLRAGEIGSVEASQALLHSLFLIRKDMTFLQ